MKYKKIKVKRLWHGFASVRDFQVEEARRKGLGLEILWNNEYIHVPYDKLDKCFDNDEVFRSKHIDGQTYKLKDYDWKTYKKDLTFNQMSFMI